MHNLVINAHTTHWEAQFQRDTPFSVLNDSKLRRMSGTYDLEGLTLWITTSGNCSELSGNQTYPIDSVWIQIKPLL